MSQRLSGQLIIENSYDSHVHWQGTGSLLNRLSLNNLKSAADVIKIKPSKNNFRGDWLLGHSWDESLWVENQNPTRQHLDQAFPGIPVKFSRVDSHSAWVSTEALKRAGLYYKGVPDPEGGRIEKDAEGWPTGLLIDMAIRPIDNLIPTATPEQIKTDLLSGIHVFNSSGFTHIRDMSCDEQEWSLKTEIAESGALTLAVEQNFHCYSPDDFPSALELAIRAKKSHHPNLRPMGTKVFLDGALGSEGAFISQPYASGSGRGVILIERIALKEIILESWSRNLQCSVHCIGDEAAHIAVTVACELWDIGEEGQLNIEHAQMLRPETINKMKGRPITCFMQASHWLSDKRWLKKKLGPLFQHLFPWAALEANNIEFYFGSDSPIEPTGIALTYRAIADAEAAGITSLKKPIHIHHQHPDKKWVPECKTEFIDGKISKIIFAGQDLRERLQ